MLKKLYKYDWKSVSSLLLVLHAILLVYSLFGHLGVRFLTSFSDSAFLTSGKFDNVISLITGLYIMAYVFFIIGIVIATVVSLAVKIQKSLFSDEGYLTNTLPVSADKILWSKVFIFWTWIAIDIFCVIASVFLLITYKETAPNISKGMGEILKMFVGEYGSSNQAALLSVVFGGIAQYFLYFTSLMLFSMCLGNLFKAHKVLGAVASFFGINFISGILNTILILLIPPLRPFSNTSAPGVGIPSLVFSIIWYVVLSVLFFLGSRYILSKKLNLD